ncbi:MAG: DUF4276 family protein [Alphaproteobacteria bacterium]|nr:DUF4276 family protein [Alphaproteobacteria bacterium]
MHFEVFVEDQSAKKTLDILIPRIVGKNNTFKVIDYKGIGRIPRDLRGVIDPNKRILLDRLPQILKGLGHSHQYGGVVVVVVCDLDNRCLKQFRQELLNVLNSCNPRPETCFCIAIEESEAWFLGDIPAIKLAYPRAKDAVLGRYINDSICGTWELLADAVYDGGSAALSKGGRQVVGAEKSIWAENISRYMDVNNNNSPSFCYFREKLRTLAS